MKLIESAYAMGSATAFVHRVENAPAIVVVLMALIGLTMVVLLVMWAFLPFALYGLKKRLDKQTAVIEALCEHLEQTRTPPAAPDVAKLTLPDDEPRFRP